MDQKPSLEWSAIVAMAAIVVILVFCISMDG